MRARNEYQRIGESYNKVLSEGAAENLRAGAARGAVAVDPVWDGPGMQWDGIDDDNDPPGEEGYDPEYKEAAYGKMIELLRALEDLKTEYADHIDPTDGFFSMIDEIIGLAGTEGEEEDDDKDEEEGIKVTDPTQGAEFEINDTDY
tara:strand:- start:1482 stop:1919 length:438 start_codon:yes stop_codon:yes gene_type:complete